MAPRLAQRAVAMTKSGAIAGKAYLCGSRPPKPGVAGKLDSWTVASLGATPLEPREGPFMLCAGSSGSLAGSSSFGKRESEAGEELWTTIEGVDWPSGFRICARREFARERERPSSPGGGDLSRGEMGQWGVVSPELDLDVGFEGRCALTVSVDDVGVSSGMLVDDRARCTDGVVELARLGPRLGLTSVLHLHERKPDLASVPEAVAARCWCGRAGDASREDSGDEGEPDTLRER